MKHPSLLEKRQKNKWIQLLWNEGLRVVFFYVRSMCEHCEIVSFYTMINYRQ